MRKQLCLFFFALASILSPAFMNPVFAASKPNEEQMPENYRKWEQENKERETKEEGRFETLWTKTLLLLAIILALLFIATYVMKRFDRFKNKEPHQKTQIQLIEKKVLSPKSVLYVVEVDGQRIALAESATNGVQLLHVLSGVDTKAISKNP
jgi:flagellar biogenesis protein FliO